MRLNDIHSFIQSGGNKNTWYRIVTLFALAEFIGFKNRPTNCHSFPWWNDIFQHILFDEIFFGGAHNISTARSTCHFMRNYIVCLVLKFRERHGDTMEIRNAKQIKIHIFLAFNLGRFWLGICAATCRLPERAFTSECADEQCAQSHSMDRGSGTN